jgi:carboxyl-terminal processing protease
MHQRPRIMWTSLMLLCACALAAYGCAPSTSSDAPQQAPAPSAQAVGSHADPLSVNDQRVAQSGGAPGTPGGVGDPAVLGTKPTLDILRKSLVNVQRRYYDQSRIKPAQMIAHGVNALQADLFEVVVSFDKPLEDEPTRFKLHVNDQSKDFDLSKVTDLSDVASVLDEVLGFVVDNIKKPQNAKELEYAVINGILETLDPHSALLTPKAYDDMQTSHGGFGGLGIVIGIRDEMLTVISPIEATPASRAGIKAGDNIMQIGEESTINMPLHEAVDRMRGEPGTEVEIFVKRKGWSEPRSFKITREMISIRSLIHHPIVEDKIAYIKIKSFERNTGEDVQNKVAELKAAMGGELKGVILDLRFNAGGLLTQAIAVADVFLKVGDIVASEGVGGSDREEHKATDDGKEPACPVIVIINPGSASASEIVAGALKNHNRAALLGETTFGKGSVQILRDFPEDGSALKITVAQYLIPGDVSIQGVGVPPDIQVLPVTITEEDGLIDVDLFVSENIRREGSLDLALSNVKALPVEPPALSLKYLYDVKDDEARNSETFNEDFEISLARKILRAAPADADRQALIKLAAASVQAADAEQTQKVTEALSKYGVNWAAPAGSAPASQPFEATISLVDGPSGRAGDTVTMRATVTNKGSAPIYRLNAISQSNNLVFDDREFLFGQVAPGESRSWDYKVKIPRGQESRLDPVTLSFSDLSGKLKTQATTSITVDGLAEPHFAYSYSIVESKGNGDGRFQVGESVEMTVWVQNNGEGESENALAFMKNESGRALYLSKGRESIGKVEKGTWHAAPMRFDINGVKIDTAGAVFKLTVYDKDFGASLERLVTLPVQTALDEVAQVTGGARFTTEAVVYGAAIPEPAFSIAKAPVGAQVTRRAHNKTLDMVQVSWKQGDVEVIGWVAASALKADSGSGPTPTLLGAHQAPRIDFTSVPREASASSIQLKGSVSDDKKINDYVVYLWSRDGQKTHAEKLDYRAVQSASGEFTVDMPLRTGVNRVRIIARDEDNIESLRDVYINKP